MDGSTSEESPSSKSVLDKLAAGPLGPEPVPSQQGVDGRFDRQAKRMLIHPFYPRLVRWFMMGVLVTLIYSASFGPRDPRLNFATVMSWIVWWPLLAVSYLLLGRVWCAFCPMGALSEVVHRRIGLNRTVPGILKNRWWVAGLLASAIFYQAWIEEVTRASYSPVFTGLILLSFTAGAVLCGFVFERWTWCRHLCPLGAWSDVFAMSSIVEIRADPNICLAKRCKGIYCYFGRDNLPGCPFHQVPKIMDTNRYCSTCGNCLKACHERCHPDPPAVAQPGILHAEEGDVGEFIDLDRRRWSGRLPTIDDDKKVGDHVRAGIKPAFAVSSRTALWSIHTGRWGLAMGLFAIVTKLYAHFTGQAVQQEMSRFGFAFLPLALMGHIGHNLSHLLTGYPLVMAATAAQLGETSSVPILSPPFNWPSLALEISLVVIGFGMSIWAIRGVCSSRKIDCPRGPAAIPYVGFAVFIACAYIWLFALPMVYRV